MKIRNDLVAIKIGDKQYDFNNLILDAYLEKFVKAQLSKEINSVALDKDLKYCLLKFDKPFDNLQENTELHNQDFDICLVAGSKRSQTNTDNTIITQYNYETENWNVWDYDKNTAIDTYLSDYVGKKITAIGFNTYWINDKNFQVKYPVCAVLDTSNYNIYLQENQNFTVIRKDIITTDALFYSNNVNKVPAPLHLMPINNKAVIEPTTLEKQEGNIFYSRTGEDASHGILYSVGLSSFIDKIDKEFIIGQDVEVVQNGTKLAINNIENLLSKYKTYLASNLYPNSNLYPSKAEYEYLIVKYKVWQNILSGTYDNPIYTMTDTGYYYHEAIPIANLKGKLNLEINYERG